MTGTQLKIAQSAHGDKEFGELMDRVVAIESDVVDFDLEIEQYQTEIDEKILGVSSRLKNLEENLRTVTGNLGSLGTLVEKEINDVWAVLKEIAAFKR